MFSIIPNSAAHLEFKDNVYYIYSYERLIIPPQDRKLVSLPIIKQENDYFSVFEIDKTLCLSGLQCIWNNLLNRAESNLQLILYNFNVKSNHPTALESIVGMSGTLDIKSNQLLGKIYFKK